ncbi:metallophosphoesterase [Flavobacterium sp.]|jgi:5'-nucleotidase|uniref:metallophosphoesterase n=1 Tax=Flavobacterium sp. TaxID=239 RepID=UPI0022BB9803|nr:metallophosphoesterase [Flavobacterium sp.]MCZ8144546.1 metallophosphoesterase [Flavobacterium sp.]MCZ8366190.1 metallophosphoesterase [Flavobacterium sp.]
MKRREFIKTTGAAGAYVGLGSLGLSSFTNADTKQITILHTNDVHSYVDPFPANHPKNPNKGGVARRAAVIKMIREENPNVLLVDAGDIFQGTPYFNYYGGELEFKLMNLMEYDVATIGNHDFDNGIDGLMTQLKKANFEMVSANYDLRNTVLDGLVSPYTLKMVDGVRIGIFGLGIALQGLVDVRNCKETKYLDPVEIATDTARLLREEKRCDLVICLSHLGFKYTDDASKICDVLLAQKTENIDLIIGGHTHTFLEKPVVELNRAGKKVLINQVGCYGLNLGRIDFYLTQDKPLASKGTSIEIG